MESVEYEVHTIAELGKFYLDNIDDFIKNILRTGLPWELHIRQLIETHAWPGTTAVDIGAHIGCHTLAMAKRVGAEGRVYAFEPQPKLHRELKVNMALNGMENVQTFCAAVGDKDGEIELSPLKEGNEGSSVLQGGAGIFVPLMTLDSLHLKNVSLIKIDVEGMEDQVLAGAQNTLRENRPLILLEIMGGYLQEKAPENIKLKIESTLLFLRDLGFTVHRHSANDYLAIS